MKFRKSGHSLLAAAVSIGIGLGITSCGQSNTIDYLYVTGSKSSPGQISVYRVDQESGALTQIPDSPYSFPGRDPIAEVTSPDGKDLYVLYQIDNIVVEYAIGTDGKLYPQNTYNTPGSMPTSIAINTAGTLLFVTDAIQPGTPTTSTPGSGVAPTTPGALVVYTRAASGSLSGPVTNGALSYWPLQNNPTGISISANGKFAYVANTNTTPFPGEKGGTVSAFTIASTGVLTPVTGSPFNAGVAPNASASDPTSRFLYVTDGTSNQLIAYGIQSNGVITPLTNGPFKTDVTPNAVTVDPSGKYLYVANFGSNDISAYTISTGNGSPSSLASNTFATKTGPTCVLVEPAFGRFVYTSNFLDSSISGFQLDPNTGILTGTENSPYPTAGQPTCAAAVTHGNHANEHVQATAGTGS